MAVPVPDQTDEFLPAARDQAVNGEGGHNPVMAPAAAAAAATTTTSQDVQTTQTTQTTESHASVEVKCGPLLNYRRMDEGLWYGSVLVVLAGQESHEPVLHLKRATTGSTAQQNGEGIDGPSASAGEDATQIKGVKLYADPYNSFWRFKLEVRMHETGTAYQYTIPSLKYASTKAAVQTFHVPALSESMRIMFHSCNGFSVGTDIEAWSGAALWNDVRRVHEKTPFHVMLGGGDQIYNDGIRVNGPLKQWTSIGNPIKRREYPFPELLRKQCDEYYVNNYIRWYSEEPFAAANGMIPQINLWDDHDIIDGFGSYVDEFMRCPVFRGIGGVAHKYYLLFQHHLAPPASTFTTDAPQTMSHEGVGKDPRQLENTYVLEEKESDPSYVIGKKPGPYVAEHSRSIVTRLGARIGFFGIDARTERTRRQVNYPETYDLIFHRLRQDLGAAASSPTPIKHLIVLLGIPIAYPRLTWLENLFSSPIMGPIKFMNKRFGLGGSFFNKFDGSIDLLDDLDDHYTARTHKKERLFLINSLQSIAAEFSVRVTILGGDVHLAAIGRFYTNPMLNVAAEIDHRYMVNVVSSAIVNKPPPPAVANLLARRNKIHHLDHNTDETLMDMFDKDPGGNSKSSSSNKVTMPSRNWAMISENRASDTTQPSANGTPREAIPTKGTGKDGHSWLHSGEDNAGTSHKAAQESTHGSGGDGGLDVCIRVEIDRSDSEGKTHPYGLSIPTLVYDKAAEHATMRRRDAVQGAISQRLHHHNQIVQQAHKNKEDGERVRDGEKKNEPRAEQPIAQAAAA